MDTETSSGQSSLEAERRGDIPLLVVHGNEGYFARVASLVQRGGHVPQVSAAQVADFKHSRYFPGQWAVRRYPHNPCNKSWVEEQVIPCVSRSQFRLQQVRGN